MTLPENLIRSDGVYSSLSLCCALCVCVVSDTALKYCSCPSMLYLRAHMKKRYQCTGYSSGAQRGSVHVNYIYMYGGKKFNVLLLL